MPSPFPGMDPFIELLPWQDFHVEMVVQLKHQLVAQVAPKYVVSAERHVYVEHLDGEKSQRTPDLLIERSPANNLPPFLSAPSAVIEAEVYLAPETVERREPYLEIRDRETSNLIAVIEFLSPSNKRSGEGAREFNLRRETWLRRPIHLLEIDLLRSGVRPATTRPLRESTDYCVMVHRREKRPAIDVYQWNLRQRLPTVPAPLDVGDADAALNPQQAFTAVYDNARYQFQIQYDTSRLNWRPEDISWAQSPLPAHP
jgi:hypothetical protein